MRVTNLALLYSALLVIAFTALAIIGNARDDVAGLIVFSAVVMLLCFVTTLFFKRIESAIKDKQNVWLQPVSKKVSKAVINGVVLIWLCVVGLIVAVMLKAAASLSVTIATIIILLAAFGYGWYLKQRFSRDSLLMYGVSYFGALIFILIYINEFASRMK